MCRTHTTHAAAALSIVLIGALVGCGGDDGRGEAGASGAKGSAGASPTVDPVAVAECLDEAGFEVTREADQDAARVLPDAYKEAVGLIESLTLGSIGEAKGTGSVGIYESSGEAERADADSAGMRTDQVQANHVGNAAYDYIVTAGDDPGVAAAIEGCLG